MNVFGAGVLDQIRDWHTSELADDVPGVASAYRQPSWDMHSVLAGLGYEVFPLATMSLASQQTVSLVAGSAAYLRFAVAANQTAQITWSGAPASVQMTLVRTR